MKVDHKISFTATAVTGGLKLFDDTKKKKTIVNTDNTKMHHFYAFLLFQLYWTRGSVQISNSTRTVYTAF